MNKGKEFMDKLRRYDLDLDTFLDMMDQWNSLSHKIKAELLEEHENYLKRLHNIVSGNPDNISKPNYENAHFNGEFD